MIFSLATGSPTEIPLTSLYDHTFGVRCVAFSKDSRWLCSVGDLHDGFVYMWAINSKTGSARLHSSNKCMASVQDIAWMGDSVISVGTRHVKVWRLEQPALTSPSKTKFKLDPVEHGMPPSPGPKILPGRNCVLGPLLDLVFTCVVAISDTQAVLGTDKGDVCLLDDVNCTQSLSKIHRVNFSITSITVDQPSTRLWLGGKEGNIQALPIDGMARPRDYPESQRLPIKPICVEDSSSPKACSVVAMGYFQDRLITVDSSRTILIRGGFEQEDAISLDAHDSAVLGVSFLNRPNDQQSTFFTWSASGSVKFWTLSGVCIATLMVPLRQLNLDVENGMNELKVVRAFSCGNCFLSGDKLGFLVLFGDALMQDMVTLKAHDGEINDIALTPQAGKLEVTLVATCGRDRTIQLFKKDPSEMRLLQTIEHGGALGQVLFFNDGAFLVASSSDRTIMVHAQVVAEKSIAYLPMRVITLRNSPVSMTVMPESLTTLLVSTMDRQIHEYDITSGHHLHSIKASDNDSNDSVIMSSFAIGTLYHCENPMKLLLGVTSTDRSIRIYDYKKTSLLLKEHGHTGGISNVAFMPHGTDSTGFQLITSGLDGTIMIWELSARAQYEDETDEMSVHSAAASPIRETLGLNQPLRRVLSRSEICDLQRALEVNRTSAQSDILAGNESPSRIRKQVSRHTLANQTLKLQSPPPLPSVIATVDRMLLQTQSSMPPSLRISQTTKRRAALDVRQQTKSSESLGDLSSSSDLICKSLRGYRKKVTTSSETLKAGTAEELERELSLTIRTIHQKTRRFQAASETVMDDLLDEHSEKLAQMIEEGAAVGMAKVTKAEGPSKTNGNEGGLEEP